MENQTDTVELILPFKAEYVSVARLTASGIANRIGFDLETIEDIKVAIAEVCNKMVNVGSRIESCYKIIFKISGNSLVIIFDCRDKSLKCLFESGEDELGVYIINALMDSVEFCSEESHLLSMSKVLEENS